MLEKIYQEVKVKLKKDDNLDISIDTIESVAKIMQSVDNPIDVDNLYWNCIIDGLDDLVKYDEEIRSK
jgi:hypothetical protein